MANIIGGSIGAGKAILNDYTLGVEDIDGGHRLTITRGSEVQTMDVLDGKNGADGKDGAPGADGRDGIDGKDGSPGAVQTVNGEAPDENGNVQVSGLPDGASANQQLVTDKDGVVKWEEKPFYSVQYGDDITWDGDTTDREIFVLGPFSFYKVSDTIYTTDTIVGRKFTVLNNSGEIEYQITENLLQSNPAIPNFNFVIPVDDQRPFIVFGSANEAVNFPGGLFFVKNDDQNFYVNCLSGTAYKRIDLLYLPEIPAEKLSEIPAEKLPEIPAEKLPEIPAEKLPEIPAEKLPEIPAEKLPSYIHTVEQKTFEGSFDKVTEGRDTFVFNAYNYYKISEFAQMREEVISFSGTRADGSVYSTITEGENCCKYGFFIVVYQAGQCTLAVNSTISRRFNAPSAGLYARYTSGNDSQTAGTYNFTYRAVRHMIQNSVTAKRYYLDVDDSGALIATEVT